jgi:hypothetical protein
MSRLDPLRPPATELAVEIPSLRKIARMELQMDHPIERAQIHSWSMDCRRA